jgi:hypothetical protein
LRLVLSVGITPVPTRDTNTNHSFYSSARTVRTGMSTSDEFHLKCIANLTGKVTIFNEMKYPVKDIKSIIDGDRALGAFTWFISPDKVNWYAF